MPTTKSPFVFEPFVEKKLKQAEAGINDALCDIPTPAYEDAVGFRILDKLQEIIGGENLTSILEEYLKSHIKDDEDDEE